MSTSMIRRGGLLAVAALLLGACQWGLALDPGAARKGQTVSVSNEGFEPCYVEVEEEVWQPGETDVVVAVITSLVDFSNALAEASAGGGLDALTSVTIVDAETDEDGIFAVDVPAPTIPGDHLVMAVCNASLSELEEDPELREALLEIQATPEDVDPEALYMLLFLLMGNEETSTEVLFVEQDPFTMSLDRSRVKAGESVVATFSWCQAENDLDFPAIFLAEALFAPVDTEEDEVVTQMKELSADHPDIDVYVDGKLVTTVTATERYPTGTVDVPLTLTEVGNHEIEGVCRYQTFEIIEEFFSDLVIESVGTAAVEYPFPPESDEGPSPFVWDEAELSATAAVEVLSAGTGAGTAAPPAQPVVTAPTYTG